MIGKIVRRKMPTVAMFSLIVSALVSSGSASAQESDEWKFRITPYLWLMGLDGTTAVLGQDVDVDESFSDILDLLNIALSANMELSKGNFFIVFDPMYAQLETDFVGPGPVGGNTKNRHGDR